MALRTFTGALTPDLRSSQAGNWDTGVPVDTDTWIIPVGLTCEWDSDQSGFATGTGGTINGTLEASTTPGYYCIKLSANLTGTGTLRAGTVGVPYPATCIFEIMRNTKLVTGLIGDLNCLEPTRQYVRTTQVEAVGQTVIEVDNSVVGDTWKDGDSVRIGSELRTIAAGGIAAGSITVTVGLTSAKPIGTVVCLMTRNVRITNADAATHATQWAAYSRVYAEILFGNNGISAGSYSVFGGTMYNVTVGIYNVTGATVNGVIFAGGSILSTSSNITINGVVGYAVSRGTYICSGLTLSSTGLFIGCATAFEFSYGILVEGVVDLCGTGIAYCSGVTVKGAVNRCTTGINCSQGIITGTISNNTTGIAASSFKLLGATFTGNTTDISQASGMVSGFGATLNAATQVNYTSNLPASPWPQVAIWNIGGVAGAFKAWMRGGRVQSQAGVVPTGRTVGYQLICESASFQVFMDRSAEVEPGDTITCTVWLRKDALMAYLPRCQLFRIENDPLLGGAVLASATMTDSLNTWEEFELEWTNTTVGPVTVVLRTLGMAAANNIYADSLILNGGEEVGGGSPFTGLFG